MVTLSYVSGGSPLETSQSPSLPLVNRIDLKVLSAGVEIILIILPERQNPVNQSRAGGDWGVVVGVYWRKYFSLARPGPGPWRDAM